MFLPFQVLWEGREYGYAQGRLLAVGEHCSQKQLSDSVRVLKTGLIYRVGIWAAK